MHITGMSIGRIPPFTEEIDFTFDKRVSVFIGPNAVGKSTLLKGLANIPSDQPYWSVVYASEGGDRWELSVSQDWPMAAEDLSANEDADGPAPVWDKVPFVYVQATRLNLLEQTDLLGTALDIPQISDENAFETTFAPLVTTGCSERADAFDARVVRSAIASQVGSAPSFRGFRKEQQFRAAIELGLRCVQNICEELIVSGNPSDFEEDVGYISEDSDRKSIIVHHAMGIATADPFMRQNGELLYAGNLSAGSQGILMWVWLLTLKMVYHYEFEAGWEERPAILIIDEIENHLHPTWQRRVIPALLDHFPGLQIFATTHSPFVVAGLKTGQVHLLKRDENGVVSATTNQQDIIGWTADEILRVFMGVGEPTDERTAKAGAELRRLRDMGTLPDEREEEQRQARIRELREIVNIAVLDGPRAAEDARFLADLRSILHRYSQQQDLNQENG